MGFPTRLSLKIGPVERIEGMITVLAVRDGHHHYNLMEGRQQCKGLFNLTRNGREMLVCQTFLL